MQPDKILSSGDTTLKKHDIRFLLKNWPNNYENEKKSWVDEKSKSLTNFGREKTQELLLPCLDAVICKYKIYCLSPVGDNNFMWNNYADNHTGFCIEFQNYPFEVKPVIYQKYAPEINMLDMIKLYLGIVNEKEMREIGKKIEKMLYKKLEKYKKEGEYRFISSGKLKNGEEFEKGEYNASIVSAVIFGSKMLPEHKKHIIDGIPFNVLFKQAINDGDSIILENYVPEKHLRLTEYLEECSTILVFVFYKSKNRYKLCSYFLLMNLEQSLQKVK